MKKEAMFYEQADASRVRCFLCAHQCKIAEGEFGFCGVRKNEGGRLYSYVYGEVIAAHVDPIEKKPLYHFLPGSRAYSIATIGCNFRCGFCQNWQISQASKRQGDTNSYELKPEEVVREAKKSGCQSISYTYTEPTIFFEYAYDTAKLAKQAGLRNNFVTNGFMTEQALETIRPYLDAANVDLKSFREEYYRNHCRASLQPVLDTIKRMKEMGIWVEVTTLIVPGENDSDDELNQLAAFIAGVDLDIPWHVSRFHPDYKFEEYPPTPLATLNKARAIGEKHKLRYIYLGNVAAGGDTHCYHCQNLLVTRGYLAAEKVNLENNACPVCGSPIKGIWG